MTPLWVTMFITSTLPVIQIVIMCSIGALLARQVSPPQRTLCMHGQTLESHRSDTPSILAGDSARSGQTTSRPAGLLRICALPDFHEARFFCGILTAPFPLSLYLPRSKNVVSSLLLLSGPEQPCSLVASASQYCSEVCELTFLLVLFI